MKPMIVANILQEAIRTSWNFSSTHPLPPLASSADELQKINFLFLIMGKEVSLKPVKSVLPKVESEHKEP